MSGFTISASEYQAMIARRDIRIAELESRLAKYESPDPLPQDDRIVGWMVYCPPGHEHDYMVFADEQSADSQAVDWESDVPHGSPIERYPLIPLVRLSDAAKYEQPDDAEPVTEDHTKLAELGFANVGDDAYGFWEHPQYGVVLVFGPNRTVMRVCHGGTRLFAPNWFQVRRLIAALRGEP